ncbi:MAG: GntG family PLP-dependent aldolase [Chloroflexota bacterium]
MANSERTGGIIDLRGDWAAPPTDEMRSAMAAAEVGDDNSGEDPTVRELEEMAAGMFGREAGLFVPSGTMGNLVSVLALTCHGDEIIVGDAAHTFVYEVGGAAVIGGHPFRTVANDRFGMMSPVEVRAAIRPENIHFPRTGLLLLENTHNLRGGAVLTQDQMASLVDIVHEHDIPVHLDGSRIFNAAAFLNQPVDDLTADVDTLTFCLSKALAAPVGSLVVGDRETMRAARQARKLLGGGMRQAGVIAAAGIVALEQMVERLPEDHEVASRLAESLAEMPGLRVDVEATQTNLVFVDTTGPVGAGEICARLESEGIRVNQFTESRFRLATHYCVDVADAERVIDVMQDILAA